jgi:hypothetical protein
LPLRRLASPSTRVTSPLSRAASSHCHLAPSSRVAWSRRPLCQLNVYTRCRSQLVRLFSYSFFFLSLIFLPNVHSFLPLRHLAFVLPLPRSSPLYHLRLASHRRLAPSSRVVPCVRRDAAASSFVRSFVFFLFFSFADLTLTPLLLAPATPRLRYMSRRLCHASRDRVVPCMSPQCFVCPSLPAKCVLLIRSFL